MTLRGQKQAEREKKAMEFRLQRSQKMEAIGLMAGGVAHDLNNILSAVVGYPELLLLDLPEESKLRRPLDCDQRGRGTGNSSSCRPSYRRPRYSQCKRTKRP